MKLRNLIVIVTALLGLLAVGTAFAAQQVVTLPKGTTVQKLGPGQFRFLLPDGRKVEARGMNARAGIIGDCGVFDAAGRKLAGGAQCRLQGAARPVIDPSPPDKPGSSAAIDDDIVWRPGSYVRIDDDIAWLPAQLVFTGTAIVDPDPPSRPLGDPDPPLRPAGLSPHPDPPGKNLPEQVNPHQRLMLNPQPEPPLPGTPR